MGVSQSLYKKEASNADRCHLSEAFDFYFSFSKMINESGKRKNDWLRSVESRRVVVDEGRGDFYIYGWTHREKKKQQKNARGNAKKEKTTSRERVKHIDAFCVFLLFFKYHFNTQTYARATPTPAKTKTKTKKTSDVAALNENLRKE